ncbi:MAG: hypothetical protein WC054_06135, partial [Candidatus Nanopelagicales bacterium]
MALVGTGLAANPSVAADAPITTWASPAQPIYDGDTQGPALALSADGSMATALWKSGNGSCNNILTASATIIGNAATWGTPVTLTDCSGGDMEDPSIALSADGTRAVAVWNQQINGTTAQVQSKSAAITGNQGNWDPDPAAYEVIQFAGGTSPKQDVAMSADGTRAVVAWSTTTGDVLNPPRLQSVATKTARVAADGTTTWEADVQYISGDGSSAASNELSTALSDDGNTAIVNYVQRDGSHDAVFSSAATLVDGVTPTDAPVATW